MIPEAEYCERHRKYYNPKEGCPVCEAMKRLKDEKFEGKHRYNQSDKTCEQGNVCGGCSGHKSCT